MSTPTPTIGTVVPDRFSVTILDDQSGNEFVYYRHKTTGSFYRSRVTAENVSNNIKNLEKLNDGSTWAFPVDVLTLAFDVVSAETAGVTPPAPVETEAQIAARELAELAAEVSELENLRSRLRAQAASIDINAYDTLVIKFHSISAECISLVDALIEEGEDVDLKDEELELLQQNATADLLEDITANTEETEEEEDDNDDI